MASSYLACMANRLFITLLALLTGLAAQIGPAQARGCVASSAEIGAVASVMAERRQALPASLVTAASAPRQRVSAEFRGLAAFGDAPSAPVVLTGIDRARE